MPLTRRSLLKGVLGAVPLGAAYPTLIEPGWLDVTHTRVALGPMVRQPLRILQLTDLHLSWCVPAAFIEHAITAGLAQKPDIVCLTGDFITYETGVEANVYAAMLRRLSQACPTFAVLGNHDSGINGPGFRGAANHKLVDRILEEAGIQLLHNRGLAIDVRGQKWNLAGIADLWSQEVEADRALNGTDAAAPVVVLAHNPDSKEVVRPFRWDLMLCGHTHGGQVMVPFEGPRFAPVVDKRFIAGLYAWDTRHIYVSRGVGNLNGVRWLCRPEATVLDLVAA